VNRSMTSSIEAHVWLIAVIWISSRRREARSTLRPARSVSEDHLYDRRTFTYPSEAVDTDPTGCLQQRRHDLTLDCNMVGKNGLPDDLLAHPLQAQVLILLFSMDLLPGHVGASVFETAQWPYTQDFIELTIIMALTHPIRETSGSSRSALKDPTLPGNRTFKHLRDIDRPLSARASSR